MLSAKAQKHIWTLNQFPSKFWIEVFLAESLEDFVKGKFKCELNQKIEWQDHKCFLFCFLNYIYNIVQ